MKAGASECVGGRPESRLEEDTPMGRNRRYRSMPIKEVELADVRALGAGVIVGIDVAKHKQFVCIASAASTEQLIVRWMHPAETREFFGLLLAMRAQGQLVSVVLEPSGTYGDPLLYGLWENGFEVRRILGMQVHAGAAALDGVRSGHDAKSAELLVNLHKLKGSREWNQRDEVGRELRAKVSRLKLYDDRARRQMGRVEGLLARHWPELTEIVKQRARIFWRMLAEYGGPRGIAADPAAARVFLRRHGRAFFTWTKIDAVIDAARDTVGVPALPEEEVWMQTVAQDYLTAIELRKQALEEVKAVAQAHADPRLIALLGAGTVGALIGYNLDPLRFDSAGALVKAMGLSLKERPRGEHDGRRRITKRGAPHVRWLMVLAAMRLIARDPVVKAWHLKKRARDGRRRNSRSGLISTVAIARKLARAAWHVARGEDFDATKLFDVSRLSVPADIGPQTGSSTEGELEVSVDEETLQMEALLSEEDVGAHDAAALVPTSDEPGREGQATRCRGVRAGEAKPPATAGAQDLAVARAHRETSRSTTLETSDATPREADAGQRARASQAEARSKPRAPASAGVARTRTAQVPSRIIRAAITRPLHE